MRRVQLRQRPLAHLELPLGDRLRRVVGNLEQERVRVAEHRLAAERGEPVERLRRLGAALHDVAEADDLVDSEPLDVLERGAEGDVVAVLVGESARRTARGYPASAGRAGLAQNLLVAVPVALVAAAVASAAIGSSRQSSQDSVSTSLLMPGVTYTREVDFTSRGPIVLDVVTAPKPDGKLYSLAPALSNNALRGREALTRLETRVAAGATTVAIDGDYFDAAPARRAASSCRTACSRARRRSGARASASPPTAPSRRLASPSPESGREGPAPAAARSTRRPAGSSRSTRRPTARDAARVGASSRR